MIVLDTDVLSIVQRGTGREYAVLTARLRAAPIQPVYATIISYEEQMRGWLAFVARHKAVGQQHVAYSRLFALVEDYRTRPLLPFDEPATVQYQHLVKQRVRIGTMDLKIAAIAMVHDAILVTRNLTDFRKVPGLVAEDWTS